MTSVFKNALLNSFYDQQYPGDERWGSKLLSNNQEENIWESLRQELLTCQSFTWVVAFITLDMLTPFKLVMADLKQKQITGTLITSDYLGFNRPEVFRELQKISNLKVKIARQDGFHAKGYLFDHGSKQTVIIGSANFTRNAMLKNKEWALKLTISKQSKLSRELTGEIANEEQNSQQLTAAWIDDYAQGWQAPAVKSRSTISREITPNQMQRAALKNLQALVTHGAKRGLVVSATGTGKTYLGAFAVQAYRPRRFLYLVHREQIAKKSLASFATVLDKNRKLGLFTGNQQDLEADYLFATVQTMSQDRNLQQFAPDSFDYILIDEAHRAAAPSYQKLLHYFKPKFWLGMTATPERMDNQDVYRIFDYNLAYEINLQDALAAKMLAPFHYLGVTDYEADGQIIDDTSNLRHLLAHERVAYILKQLAYYGFSGKKAKGLIFCSRRDEAQGIAQAFSQAGHPTVSLTNTDSIKHRQEVVGQLQAGKLEYISTVDLFNEGIDIPALNQVIMLRNTQSSIVFIQQLGRALRKYPGKEFATIIDFIGNYKNNYLIPLALTNDHSSDRDQARSETVIPQFIDLSTINFSQIAAKRILHSLNKIKLDSFRALSQAYQELKDKLGRPPLLIDFAHYGSCSPLAFVRNPRLPNYAVFLQKKGVQLHLTVKEQRLLTFVTKELANGKRLHELLLLQALLQQDQLTVDQYRNLLKKHGAYVNEEVLKSVLAILSLSFFAVKAGKKLRKDQYGGQSLVELTSAGYCLADGLKAALKDHDFCQLFTDAIETGLLMNQPYQNSQQFTYYQRYSRKDVCRLLNWSLDVSAPMYGYRVGEQETPIFITYQKGDQEKRNAVYHNELVDGQSLHWVTRSPRHLDSEEVQRLLAPQMRLHLFVKRSDAAGKEFYYLGQAQIVPGSVKEEAVGAKKRPAVGMDLRLQKPLTTKMYQLLFADFNE